jgi:hypothetical protein
VVAIVFAGFVAYGAWRAPMPGVNEPHYLCKARHFWDPAWCARDFFLQSSNPHWVYYATVGALTRILTLEQTAWLGRVLVWILLAVGWVALTRSLLPHRWGAVWSAALFLGLSATGNLSGEWLIGGVEAKGFAYAALFLGLAAACDRRALSAAIWCGVAVSFHPVVGVWGATALCFALAWRRLAEKGARGDDGATDTESSGDVDRGRPAGVNLAACGVGPVRSFALQSTVPALICLACSLPGLIPALALLAQGTSDETSHAGDELQVFERLDHHLDPKQFPASMWGMYALLLGVWLATRPWKEKDPARRLFAGFVLGSLLIAAAGAAVGFGPRWAGALKFYPFRLADLFLPIATALACVRGLESIAAFRFPRFLSRRWMVFGAGHALSLPEFARPPRETCRPRHRAVGHVLSLAAFAWALAAPGDDRNPTGWTEAQRADWLDVCRWVAGHVPADALCLTPRYRNYTFKWYAGRSEFVTWKDCPQDAPGLVEWKRRLDTIHRWRTTHFETGLTKEALEELRESTEVDYIVDWYIHPYRVEPEYANRSFRVYRVGDGR